MSEKAEVTRTNEVGQARKGGRVKRFLRRFWWLLLIVTIIILLAVALPIIFVGIPNIAQGEVNKSTLNITKQVVSNPTPTTIDLELTNVAQSNSSFHPTLGAFKAALFLEDTEPNIKPFAYVDIPASQVAKETLIHAKQTVQIADMEQFKRYNLLVMKSETYRVGVRGVVSLKLKGFRAFDVDYNKAVTMKGLNGLAGFQVKNFTIMLTPESDGTNMVGQVFIPNPSVLTINLGNVTLDLSVAGTPIGQSTIPNLVLNPGDNTLDMRSKTNQSAVLTMITTKYKDGILPIDIVGNSSVNSAGEHLPYFEEAVKGNALHVSLDVGKALAAIGLNITGS